MVKKYTFKGITNKIVILEWKWSVKNSDATVVSIFWEFYANASKAIDNKEMIRGVLVPFGLSNINAFYGLRDAGQGEYKNYLDNVS